MTDSIRQSYEQHPYPGRAFQETHPDSLAALARLHGLTAPPPNACRVLEIGCAEGGNIVPMALALPGSRFLGIDLSPRQIATARETAHAVGVTNLELRVQSVTDVDASFGLFDYIVCHGVYSWVPPEVQAHILQVMSRNLTPDGVAYVSFNTLPGWHSRAGVREMMLYHIRGAEPSVRAPMARELLGLLIEQVPEATPYGILLREERAHLGLDDWYLIHEHLDDYNEPIYFAEMAQRVEKVGLKYLAEAARNPRDGQIIAKLGARLDVLGKDRTARTQYVDFVAGRTFHKSAFCHADRVTLEWPSADAVGQLLAEGQVTPATPGTSLSSDEPLEFRGRDQLRVTTNDPVLKTALAMLGSAAPAPIAVSRLCDEVAQRFLDVEPAALAQRIRAGLLECWQAKLVVLHEVALPLVATVSEKPEGSPLSRYQARNLRPVTSVTHRMIDVDPLGVFILPFLDGTSDRAELRRRIVAAALDGQFTIERDGQPVTGEEALEEILADALEVVLKQAASSALLVA